MRLAPIIRGFVLAALLLPATELPAAETARQQTKNVQLLLRKWLNASGSEKVETEERLRAAVEQRAETLKTALAETPEIVIELALPKETSDALPRDLQNQMERAVSVQGTVDQSAESKSRGIIHLRDRLGRKLTLYCVGAPPALVKGSSVSAKGWQLGNAVVATCGSSAEVAPVSASGLPAQPLALELTHPKQGAVLRQTVEISAGISGNPAASVISFYRDGALLGRRERSPYTFSWDTRRESDGPHQLAVRGSDADMNVGHAAITVTVDNTPPRVTLIEPATGRNVSGIVRCEAQASDVIGLDVVRFLLDSAVIGVLVRPPYALSWDTTAVPNGLHNVSAVGVDRAGNETRSAAADIRVLNANAPPILTPIGPKTIEEGMTLAFTVLATDPNSRGEPLKFTASRLPSWAKFDPLAHAFSGTPDFSTASSAKPQTVYPDVLFEVCDTQPLCAREAISITVKNVNRPPVMNPVKNREIMEEEKLSVTPLITEPDGDAISCTARLIPPWTGFNAETCTLHGSPPPELASLRQPARTYKEVTIKACDPEENCAASSFNITVRDVAHGSKLNLIGEKSVDETRLLQFAVSAADADRDTISLDASPLPPGATFTDNKNGTGLFSWTPAEHQAGIYEVVFEASDRNDGDTETVAITVNETHLSISGIVQDTLGEGFPGVLVEAAAPNAFTRSAVTDANGIFLIRDLRPGSYRLRPIQRTGTNLPGSRSETGLGIVGASDYSFEPFYYQVEIKNADKRDLSFTAVPRD